ncbi:MAG TPA: serine/threonine-protein kinase [Actinocrinis sp.]
MAQIEHDWQLVQSGTLIAGRYRLTRWLGLAGSREVWAAWDERLSRDVAVKLIADTPGPTDLALADRFVREAIALARINHPNVVTVYDQGEHLRHRFLVMELVSGLDLAELKGGARPMPIGAAVSIGLQVSRALGAAHAVGVVHRDVKPTNIMITHDGVVKVLDFCVAGFVRAPDATISLALDEPNVGSASYLAPERISGGEAGPRSDLYSLGCVLYELLTGQPPFPEADDLLVLDRHLHQQAPPMRTRDPEIPAEVDQLVCWLLAKDPADRPTSVAVVSARLESLARAYPADLALATAELLAGSANRAGRDAGGALAESGDPAALGEPTQDLAGPRRFRFRPRPGTAGSATGTGRRSRWRPATLVVCVAAALVLAVVADRQFGSSPTSSGAPDQTMAGGPSSNTASAGAGKGAAPSAAASSAPASMAPSSPAMMAAGFEMGLTPPAPTAPYRRSGQVAPGDGCKKAQDGVFACFVGRTGGAPVYQPSSQNQAGMLAGGNQTFYCQSSGAEYTHAGFDNLWWAWAQSDQGTFGWVSAVDLAGGSNDSPEPGLPYCSQ